jgi:hypothetical protein
MAHVRFCRRADGRETIRLASGERFLGARRCPDCHLYGRSVGLGGSCPDCETIILLADLLEQEAVAPS